jgi:hypothetical protein
MLWIAIGLLTLTVCATLVYVYAAPLKAFILRMRGIDVPKEDAE